MLDTVGDIARCIVMIRRVQIMPAGAILVLKEIRGIILIGYGRSHGQRRQRHAQH